VDPLGEACFADLGQEDPLPDQEGRPGLQNLQTARNLRMRKCLR